MSAARRQTSRERRPEKRIRRDSGKKNEKRRGGVPQARPAANRSRHTLSLAASRTICHLARQPIGKLCRQTSEPNTHHCVEHTDRQHGINVQAEQSDYRAGIPHAPPSDPAHPAASTSSAGNRTTTALRTATDAAVLRSQCDGTPTALLKRKGKEIDRK